MGLPPSAAPVVMFLLAVPLPSQWAWGRLPEVPTIDGFGMAWDPLRSRVVLFGGVAEGNPMVYFDETWEWDGARWVLRRTATVPPARAHAALTWDPVNQAVLLFGGKGTAGVLSDTWLYDGRTWRQVTGTTSPAPRVAHRMATDLGRGRIVLFGGFADTFFSGQQGMQDTWEWDGMRWTQRFPATLLPTERGGHGMAYHANTGRVAIFGGSTYTANLPTVPLLEWDGTDWIQVPATAGVDPGALRMAQGMADPTTGGLILYGGGGPSGATDRTFRWLNGGWALLAAGNTVPGARVSTDPAEVDARLGEMVTFGRIDFNTRTQQDESTWVLGLAQGTWRSAHPYLRVNTRDIVFDSRRDGFWVVLWVNSQTPQMWWLTDDGYSLVQSQPPLPPLGRLAYDEATGLVMTYDATSRATWTWDGTAWLSRQYPTTPSLSGAAFSDAASQRLLYYTDKMVWAWQPGAWTILTLREPSLPHINSTTSVGYDQSRARLVVIGEDPNQLGSRGLWEWDGAVWTRSVVPLPVGIEGRRLHYVPDLGGLVLVGAVPGEWLWDGISWTPLAFPQHPPTTNAAYLDTTSAHDSNRRRIRMIVWIHGIQQQIWDLAVRSLSVSRPDPNPGDVLSFSMDAPTEANKPWLLGLSTARYPGIPLGPAPHMGTATIPLAPDWLLSLSLSSWIGGVLDAQGRGQAAVWVPGTTALVGFRCHAAAVTLGTGISIDHISADIPITIVP